MPKYREERRKRKYLLNNGSSLAVTTVAYVDTFLGIRTGPRHITATTLDGRKITAAQAKAAAKASGYDLG
jgi:hypothetical protein